jgi:hypothetical protein
MKEVKLPIEMVEQVLQFLSEGTTGKTGQLFFGIQELSRTQLKEFNDNKTEEAIKARIEEAVKAKTP